MTTTTKLCDFLGRWLGNATPGTTAAVDQLGRTVVTGNKDYLGRGLTLDNPAAPQTTHAYSLGDYVRASNGSILQCTHAGTSGGSAATPPAQVGGTVADGSVTWQRVH